LSSIPGLEDISNVNTQSGISITETPNVAATTDVNNTNNAPVNSVCICLFIHSCLREFTAFCVAAVLLVKLLSGRTEIL